MELINGKNFFRLLIFLFLSGCSGENNKGENGIYFKIKNRNDYSQGDIRDTDNGYEVEALDNTTWFLFMDKDDDYLLNLTFYNADGDLLKRSFYQGLIDDTMYCKFNIRSGKVHGKFSTYKIIRENAYPLIFQMRNDDGTFGNYVENLILEEEMQYYHGIRHGAYRKFREGHLVQSGNYVFGNESGDFISYYDNGRVSTFEHYTKTGLLHGKRIEYYQFGQTKRIDNYQFGQILSSQLFDNTGKLVEERQTKDTKVFVRAYDELSQSFKNYTLEAIPDKIVGNSYILFDDEGELIGKMDLSQMHTQKFTVTHSKFTCTAQLQDDNEVAIFTYTVTASDGTTYHYDNSDIVRHYKGNKLLGVYNTSNQVVNGEFDFTNYGKYNMGLSASALDILMQSAVKKAIYRSEIDQILIQLKEGFDDYPSY
jgi:antitoxin component YwqK of YwqJK toxin-antitoxin module